jgi:hypothetical protein
VNSGTLPWYGRLAFRSTRGGREKAENSEKSGSQGWDVFSLLPFVFLARCSWKFVKPMKTLGICWIAYGVFRVCMGIAQILFAPTATVMFGALLGRVADPFTLMGLFHVIYVGLIVWSFVCGVLGITGGFASLGGSRSGVGLLIIASLLSLSEVPLGIALGVYTLIHLAPARRPEVRSN